LVTVGSGVLIAAVGLATGLVPAALFGPTSNAALESEDVLFIEADDAEYLNRVYEETDHEVAYCGLITHEEPPKLEVWLANTVQASPTQVAFITENCPDSVQEVLIHTHPNGVLRLSDHDREALSERPEQFTCIHGGPISTAPGEEVENLACYREIDRVQNGPELTRVPVVISAK
jgi:proteasome lid subunit RPN8/RPN11